MRQSTIGTNNSATEVTQLRQQAEKYKQHAIDLETTLRHKESQVQYLNEQSVQ